MSNEQSVISSRSQVEIRRSGLASWERKKTRRLRGPAPQPIRSPSLRLPRGRSIGWYTR